MSNVICYVICYLLSYFYMFSVICYGKNLVGLHGKLVSVDSGTEKPSVQICDS